MDEIDTLLSQIRARGSAVWVAGPQSEAAIAELEQALGAPLPPSYRTFLARFGGLGIGNWFVSGIIAGRIQGQGSGWAFGDTLCNRRTWKLPDRLLVVHNDPEAPNCLDLGRRGADGECPVVCYEVYRKSPGFGSEVGANFGAWLSGWLRLWDEGA